MQSQLSLTIQQPLQTLKRWGMRRITQTAQPDPAPTVYGLTVRTGIKAGQGESTYTVTYSSPTPRVIEE